LRIKRIPSGDKFIPTNLNYTLEGLRLQIVPLATYTKCSPGVWQCTTY